MPTAGSRSWRIPHTTIDVWIFRRVLALALTLWLAISIIFFLLRLIPGDAIQEQLIESGAGQATIEMRREAAGLTRPVAEQYLLFLSGLLRGDLGVSLRSGQPVALLIGQQLAPTLELAVGALWVAVFWGCGWGGLAGLSTIPAIRSFSRCLLSLSLSIPVYWSGTIALYLFSAQLGWLPSSGWGGLQRLALPALVLGIHTAGAVGQVVEASLREIQHAEFVRTAHGKGLLQSVVIGRHIIRAALPPILTVIGLQAGFLLSGVVITEALFTRPGLGRLLLDGVLGQDYPLVQGIVAWSAVTYAIIYALTEILIRWVDPRFIEDLQ